tara:strand:- start:2912 stop:3700 length:789 start_codon:yes stop_codon:yes gene_type:complete
MPKLDNNVDLLIKFSSEKIKNIIEGQFNIELCFVSAIFGKSDKIEFLLKNFNNVDKFVFVFTDDNYLATKKYDNPRFKVIFVPEDLRLNNPRLTAKIFKVFIPLIFKKFSNSAIWLDANLIISDCNALLEHIDNKSRYDDTIILFNHRKKSRNIISEVIQIYIFGKDNLFNLLKVLFYLFKHLYRDKRLDIFLKKIFWGGFIYFKKLDQNISYYWWEFIKLSIRDQLSLPLIVYKSRYTSLPLEEVKKYILSVEHLTYKHYH